MGRAREILLNISIDEFRDGLVVQESEDGGMETFSSIESDFANDFAVSP